MAKVFENFYNIIFSPKEAFANLKASSDIEKAIAIVFSVALFAYILEYDFSSKFNLFTFVGYGIITVVCALFMWLLFCFFIDKIAGIFSRGGKIEQLLVLIAFSELPWLLFAPAELLKSGGGFLSFIGILIQVVIALYVLSLYIKSVAEVYELNILKALALVSIPLVGSFFAFVWPIGFFSKMIYIFSV